jgi:hypothetical protein
VRERERERERERKGGRDAGDVYNVNHIVLHDEENTEKLRP